MYSIIKCNLLSISLKKQKKTFHSFSKVIEIKDNTYNFIGGVGTYYILLIITGTLL
jgi:predicted nucleic-acid-binding Zn-ribbon protein